MLHFDNDNRKHKKKKKKKKHERKLKDLLEYLDPRFQKETWEKQEESRPPDDHLCEQYRTQGTKHPSKEEKPSGAGDSKKRSSLASTEYVRGKGLGCWQDSWFFTTISKCLWDEIPACYPSFQMVSGQGVGNR